MPKMPNALDISEWTVCSKEPLASDKRIRVLCSFKKGIKRDKMEAYQGDHMSGIRNFIFQQDTG